MKSWLDGFMEWWHDYNEWFDEKTPGDSTSTRDTVSFQEIKTPPQLRQGEKEEFALASRIDTRKPNAVIAGTDQRLFVEPKRGKEIPDSHKDKVGVEMEYDDIDVIRRMGALQKKFEIVCGETVYELPPVQNDSDVILEGIRKHGDYEEREVGKGPTGRIASQITSLVVGIPLSILGLIGFILSIYLFFAGDPIGGIFTMFGAGIVAVIAFKIFAWGFHKDEEWVRIDENRHTNERESDQRSKHGLEYDHYTDAVDDIKQLKREKEHEKAEELLLWCIEQTEAEQGQVAPWYYRHLGIIYRKDERYDDEVEILERYVDVAQHPDPDMVERLEKARELASEK